jgi:hypothetical protein
MYWILWFRVLEKEGSEEFFRKLLKGEYLMPLLSESFHEVEWTITVWMSKSPCAARHNNDL